MSVPNKQAREFLNAAESLRKGLAAAACVMQECPSCNKVGNKVAQPALKSLVDALARSVDA